MKDFRQEAEALRTEITELRRDLHRHPELSGREFRTADLIAGKLSALGLEVRRDCADAYPSAVAVLRGARPGQTVALRADMDALEITEATGLPFRSQTDGVMHACGHDAHTAMLYGAAKLLSARREELCGSVKFIFEPAEEHDGGAQYMAKNGVMDDVDAVFGLHVENAYPVGTVMLRAGEYQASSDRVDIHILGKSGHGAMPHLCVDAIVIAAQYITAIQTLLTREKHSARQAVVTVGSIHGGTRRNVICDDVEMKLMVRTFDPDTRELLCRRLEELLKSITEGFGGSYSFERSSSHPAVINDAALTEFAAQTARGLLGSDAVRFASDPEMTAESFGYFSRLRPGTYFHLGTGNPQKGCTAPLHSSSFIPDEDALPIGAALEASLAYEYLRQHAAQ